MLAEVVRLTHHAPLCSLEDGSLSARLVALLTLLLTLIAVPLDFALFLCERNEFVVFLALLDHLPILPFETVALVLDILELESTPDEFAPGFAAIVDIRVAVAKIVYSLQYLIGYSYREMVHIYH